MSRQSRSKRLRKEVADGLRGAVAARLGMATEDVPYRHPLGDDYILIVTRVAIDASLQVDSFAGINQHTTIDQAADALLAEHDKA